jgi:hypothetical protein
VLHWSGYGTVPYNIQGSWDIFILFTICLQLTAVAGRCSQLAARICHRCPYDTLLVTAPPAPTTPCYFSYLLLAIYAPWHAESLDLLAAEAGLDIRLDIPQAHDLEAAEVFI